MKWRILNAHQLVSRTRTRGSTWNERIWCDRNTVQREEETERVWMLIYYTQIHWLNFQSYFRAFSPTDFQFLSLSLNLFTSYFLTLIPIEFSSKKSLLPLTFSSFHIQKRRKKFEKRKDTGTRKEREEEKRKERKKWSLLFQDQKA